MLVNQLCVLVCLSRFSFCLDTMGKMLPLHWLPLAVTGLRTGPLLSNGVWSSISIRATLLASSFTLLGLQLVGRIDLLFGVLLDPRDGYGMPCRTCKVPLLMDNFLGIATSITGRGDAAEEDVGTLPVSMAPQDHRLMCLVQ